MRTPIRPPRTLLLLAAASAALAGCKVGPNYERPSAIISANFKEAQGFSPAAPADALDRGDWWTLFNDPVLSDLEARVRVSNQSLIASEAAYRQARAAVAEQRAALFPTISLDAGATRSGGGNRTGSGATGTTTTSSPGSTYRAELGGSWELDVWGRIRRLVEAARATAQASAADLAAATLSMQGELAADYFGLRAADAQIELDRATVAGYQRALQIAQNRYNVGVADRSEVLQAQTQLTSANADLAGVQQQRGTYEHAIAVLTGQAPGDFNLVAVQTWTPTSPDVPPGVPSTLLQRRPDIAAAERRMAAANAQIGVARAAYFPTLDLTGSYGFVSTELGHLFSASNSAWSLGLAAADDLFDGGARKARVTEAKAAYDEAVANYRQTVLTALQDVEDRLAAAKVLAVQVQLRQQASASADAAETIIVNRYQAGQVAYTDVVTAQTSAYAARNALVQAESQRQANAVALIQALGGGWSASSL